MSSPDPNPSPGPAPAWDDDRPIFVVGCPRSGTTVLRDLLRSHPRLSFPHETHFIPAFYRGYGDPRTEREARALARRILALDRIRAWRLELRAEDFSEDRSFAAVLRRLYRAWAAREGRPRWGDKTPHYLAAMPLLQRLFPAARFVHIYRDGRDVALSWLKAGYEPRNLYSAAAAWAARVRQGRAQGSRLGAGCYHEVRYESLLAQPEATLRGVCGFVGESFDERVLVPTALPIRAWLLQRPRPARKALEPHNSGKWRTQMTREERALFESAAGDVLRELGYEVEGLSRRLPLAWRAAWSAQDAALRLWIRLRSPNRGPILRTWLAIQRARIAGAWRRAGRARASARPPEHDPSVTG